jgi:hypothetical protein
VVTVSAGAAAASMKRPAPSRSDACFMMARSS